MGKHFFLRSLFSMLLLFLGLNAFADTKTGSWDLTSSSSDWTASGNATYFSQPYGFKKANGTLTNKSISDFSTEGITEIKVGFKCLQNGATTSQLTVYLVDKDGNTVGDGVVVTPTNASSASKTTYQYATFTSNFSGATGFMMKVTTFGKNILVNGAEYTITYSASTKTLTSLSISGSPTKTTYTAGDVFDPTGLVVTGTYDDNTTANLTSKASWTIDYGDGNDALVKGVTSVGVTATVGTVSSPKTTISGLTVNAKVTLESITISGDLTKSEYTVGDDFSYEGLTATGNYSDGSTSDLTSTVTWTVEPTTLAAATTSVTVKATSGTIVGTKDYAVTVNKKASSITIANMTIDKDAENVAISATTTPTGATLSYAITEGSDYITITDGKVTAKAVGKATVKATYDGSDEYTTAETTFTVTVANASTATIGSFTAISGNINDDITYEAQKGKSSTNPIIASNCLRLYQNGGYVILKGVKGVKIQSVTITTGSTYASTTVGYCVDNGTVPTSGETVTKSSSYTISGLNNQEVEIYCLATDKNNRLDIASITVKYTKETVTLSSITISGEYQTSFCQHEKFNHDNANVTAIYSDNSTEDVTSSTTFSTPDLKTAGDKTVTVSYTEDGVTKNTTYTINVKDKIVESIAISGTFTKNFKTTDTFSHEGAIVTATYNCGHSEEVTADAEFSTPDLTTTGTKTVTVTYAGTTATYNIKVIPSTAIFFESFDGTNGVGGNDGNWGNFSKTSDIIPDNDDWTFTSSCTGAKNCVKIGTSTDAGSAKTPAITINGDALITFKAGSWTDESVTLVISATNGTLTKSSMKLKAGEWTEYSIGILGVTESTQITFASSGAYHRFFLDEVLVENYSAPYIDLTIGNTGYASYYDSKNAYLMPSDCEGYVAYYDADDNWKFEVAYQGDDVVPADEALVLHSNAIGQKKLYIIDESPTKVDNNDLKGTDDQTALENDDDYYYYGFSLGPIGTAYVNKVGFYWRAENGAAFTNGAHKAYLMVLKSRFSDQSKIGGFALEGDEADGINIVNYNDDENDNMFNIAGQRVNAPVRGQIYIMNGKKYIAK